MTRETDDENGFGEAEQRRLASLNAATNASFLDWLDFAGNEEVLEIGCGLGLLTAEIARRVPRGHVVGIEPSDAQLVRAKALASSTPNLHIVSGDAQALPFARETFDVVYCRWVLEHVESPARTASEARRVLRVGGRFAAQENDVSLVRFDPEIPLFDEVWRAFAELQRSRGGDPHIGRKLFGLCRRAGFKDVRLSVAPELHVAGSPGFSAWIDNLAANVRGAANGLVARGLVKPSRIAEALAELESLSRRDDASATFVWNRVVARAG